MGGLASVCRKSSTWRGGRESSAKAATLTHDKMQDRRAPVIARHGDVVLYNPAINTLAVKGADGTPKTRLDLILRYTAISRTWTISVHKKDNHCRVCGYGLPIPPWGADGRSPTWEICPCCGTEFGYEDCTPTSTRSAREKWIANGKKWFDATKKPANWSFDSQSEDIPDEFS